MDINLEKEEPDISLIDDNNLRVNLTEIQQMQGIESESQTLELANHPEVGGAPLISEEQKGNDHRNASEYQHMTGDEEQFQVYRLLSDDSQESSAEEGTICPHDAVADSVNICTRCNKNFSTKGSLTRHLMIHDGVKRFRCIICGKEFGQIDSLKRHMLTHTHERPFICEVCEASFKNSQGLKSHKLVHTKGKPFICEFCAKRFRQMKGLKRHINIKHLLGSITNLYPCSICDTVLHSKLGQLNHMKNHWKRDEPKHGTV